MKIENDTIRAVLAILMIVIAAGLVFLWMIKPPTGDGNAVALLAGFVTLFLKGAVDLASYYTQSSAGSDKKTDAIISNGAAPPAPAPAPAAPTQ